MASIDFEVFYPHIKEVAVEVGCAPVQPTSFLLAEPELAGGASYQENMALTQSVLTWHPPCGRKASLPLAGTALGIALSTCLLTLLTGL